MWKSVSENKLTLKKYALLRNNLLGGGVQVKYDITLVSLWPKVRKKCIFGKPLVRMVWLKGFFFEKNKLLFDHI